MSTLVILATKDDTLADAWERQLLPGKIALRLSQQDFPSGVSVSFSAVVVLDAAMENQLPRSLVQCATIFVGEPSTLPFEQARMAGRAKIYLSYPESLIRLRELLPLVEEVAEKHSLIAMLKEQGVRGHQMTQVQRSTSAETVELWDFFESAVECIDDRNRLLIEFRRATRQSLRASHSVLFLRGPEGFQADLGTSFFPLDDPLVRYFEFQPMIVDGMTWPGAVDPVAEMAIRNRLALWVARMLVPIHDNGRLLGLVALGVREDGQNYDETDRERAVYLARLLRHLLWKSAQFTRLSQAVEKATIGVRYLPGTLVLGSEESAPRNVPLVVRDIIGRARRSRDICRVAPAEGQPFRVSAGIITENGGVWAYWEEASNEVHESLQRERASRRDLLRELALTLSHELSNSLVSLASFRQSNGDLALPRSFIETMKADVSRLEALNNNISVMQALHEAVPTSIDARDLAQRVGIPLGVSVEVGPDPIMIRVSAQLLEYAISALLQAILAGSEHIQSNQLIMKVRFAGVAEDSSALFSIRGKFIELEGVFPEPTINAVPSQGRLSVFIAKEILAIHRGEIHAGPGIDRTEILFSVRGM